ncbi:hypothetical protein DL764_007128 [Monosporascus ibericus]|uniref:Uncharacterized protein n=1 Tax=Monosporascus ibericus TaxID=155417 RepID=A0A4Q4T2Z8_9PEZI|nr:hypothetical protein DL764_007128 [Monosporascus ibericus]
MATNTPTTGSVISRPTFDIRITAVLNKMKEIKALKQQRNDAIWTGVRNHPDPMRPFHDVMADYKRSATLLHLNLQSVFDHTFNDLAVEVQQWVDVSTPLQKFATTPSQDRSSTQFGADLASFIYEYVTEELKPLAQGLDKALWVGARKRREPFRICLNLIAERTG